ncbi:hypothetical protein, partial [Acetobacter tropicalis]
TGTGTGTGTLFSQVPASTALCGDRLGLDNALSIHERDEKIPLPPCRSMPEVSEREGEQRSVLFPHKETLFSFTCYVLSGRLPSSPLPVPRYACIMA